jgi:hypothetical protein
VRLPFTIDQFLGVFRAYNLAVWPSQVLWYLLAVALVLLALRGGSSWHRWGVTSGLTLLWAWMGAVYHLHFFSAINPAAVGFGLAFLVQAAVWILWAWRTPALGFRPRGARQTRTGAVLLGYALVVYPVLNFGFGHRYPAMPTFGLPCPTTIATLGLLAWTNPRPPWFVWAIPVLWAVVGTGAALMLGVWEDLGLPLAAALALMANGGGARRSAPA